MEQIPISLVQLADQLSRIIIPIIIFIGVVSNSLNIVILTRPRLYQQACTRYFLANTSSNLFYSSVILVYRLLYDRRTENQLVRMLLLQVGTYIVLTVPSSITYLIFVLPNNLKTTPTFFFASMISVLPFHLSYATAFFLYVLSAQVYRKEFLRLRTRIIRPTTDINNIM